MGITFKEVIELFQVLNNETIQTPVIINIRIYVECSNPDCKSPIYLESIKLSEDKFYCLHCDEEHNIDIVRQYPKILFHFNSKEIDEFLENEMSKNSNPIRGNELSKILGLGKPNPEGSSPINRPSGVLPLPTTGNGAGISIEQFKQNIDVDLLSPKQVDLFNKMQQIFIDKNLQSSRTS